MIRRSHLSLLLAFVLAATGLAGCNRGEKQAETQPQKQKSEAPAPGAPTPGTPAPGTPAPSAPAPEAPLPGAAPGQSTPPAGADQLPAVVARCNGQEIKKEELIARAQEMRLQLARTR